LMVAVEPSSRGNWPGLVRRWKGTHEEILRQKFNWTLVELARKAATIGVNAFSAKVREAIKDYRKDAAAAVSASQNDGATVTDLLPAFQAALLRAPLIDISPTTSKSVRPDGAAGRRSPVRDREFLQHLPYTGGDSRDIDWKAYARTE